MPINLTKANALIGDERGNNGCIRGYTKQEKYKGIPC